MTIKSLQDLNTYAQTPITYNDVRTAQVLFDRGATVDQTLTVSENTEFVLPWGINIDDITQYDVADVEYHIDLTSWSDPVSISWDYLPPHIVVTRGSGNDWIVSEIRSRQDWLYVRQVKVIPPFGFTGFVQHEASIQYYSDNQDSSRDIVGWDIDLTFTQVEYFASTVDRTYTSNTLYSNFNPTSITIDPEDFDPVWDLRIYADDAGAIEEIFSDGSAAEALWNDTTKQYVVTGDTDSVNEVLASLDLETDRFDADFVLYFKLANNYTSSIEYQVQQFLSRDFISDQTVTLEQLCDNNYIRGFVGDPFVAAAEVSSAPNRLRDPNPTEITGVFTPDIIGGIIFQLDDTLEFEAGIIPNGGYLLEGDFGQGAAFDIVPNGGFLIEGSATLNSTGSSVECVALKHAPNTAVFTLDQTLMPGWTGTGGSNWVYNRFDLNYDLENSSDYTITIYGRGGKGSTESEFNDNISDEPYVILAITYTGTTPEDIEIQNGWEQIISIDNWGYFADYQLGLQNATNLKYFSPNGPTNTSSTQTALFSGIRTDTHTHADDLFDQIADFGPNVFTDLSAYVSGSDFNKDISDWDTSAVTNMSSMFANTPFNQNINSWDVSSVTTMKGMFGSNPYYNQSMNSWDTSSVTDMSGMFRGAVAFTGNISAWDTSAVTTFGGGYDGILDTTNDYGMFEAPYLAIDTYDTAYPNNPTSGAYWYNFHYRWGVYPTLEQCYMKFNGNITGWDTSSATDMSGMFRGCLLFNQDIGSWNTNSLTNTVAMFEDARAFDYSIDTDSVNGYWNVSSVTNMDGMFNNAKEFNQDLNNWDTSSVTDMDYMFRGREPSNRNEFNGNISSWDTSSVTTMVRMFAFSKFNQDIGSWDTSNVTGSGATGMYGMFLNNIVFDQDISGWCVSQITTKPGAFDLTTNSNWTDAEKPQWGDPCT